MANRTTIHTRTMSKELVALQNKALEEHRNGSTISLDSIFVPLTYDRVHSMLNFLRHASDRGRKELVLKMDDFEYNILILLAAVGNIIIKSRTKTDITILVEKP